MRIMLYSPDSYGLGHVRRSLSVADALLGAGRRAAVRLVTGAPRAHYFDYPAGCDYLKLPVVTKDDGGRYVGGDVELSLEETVRLRARLILEAAEIFRGHLLLVDHAPLGLCREVLPTLRRLGRRPGATKRVLGMRDVIDAPEAVRVAWSRQDVHGVLRDCYDRILVYGDRDLFDPIRAYGIPDDIAEKMCFVGYIPRSGTGAAPADLRARFAPRTGRLVLVTLGGGGDGNPLLRVAFEAYRSLGPDAPFEMLAVTGPLMSPRKRDRFKRLARELPGLHLLEYTHEIPDLMRAADFVVSMGGYNTVCELACAGANALIVPRCFPRQEQLIRARLLADRGVAACLTAEQIDPSTLARAMREGVDRPRGVPGWGLAFTGLERTVREVDRLLSPTESMPVSPVASVRAS